MHFLVVYEDIWHNKESYFTEQIGDTIKQIMETYELVSDDLTDESIDRYNSENPYDKGTFGKGFYDIDLMKDDEYAGRIMIFDLTDFAIDMVEYGQSIKEGN